MRSFSTEKSSRITSIDYDPESRTMRVVFKRGGVYEYFEVPQEVFDGLIQAQSLGKAFEEHVKGKYRYSRLV